MGDSVTISLEARLLNGPKALRHIKAGDFIGLDGASIILEALVYGNVYYEQETKNLIYLFPHSAGRYSKITVNPKITSGGRGSKIVGPGVVNIETIGSDLTDGEFRRITQGLKKIK